MPDIISYVSFMNLQSSLIPSKTVRTSSKAPMKSPIEAKLILTFASIAFLMHVISNAKLFDYIQMHQNKGNGKDIFKGTGKLSSPG